jgi:hypothetical protein
MEIDRDRSHPFRQSLRFECLARNGLRDINLLKRCRLAPGWNWVTDDAIYALVKPDDEIVVKRV